MPFPDNTIDRTWSNNKIHVTALEFHIHCTFHSLQFQLNLTSFNISWKYVWCIIVLSGAAEGNGMETFKCHTVYGWADFPHLIKFKPGF